jgi:signal transduction histidine kinase
MTLRTEQKLPIILSVVFLTITTFGILFYQSTESLRKARELDRNSSRFLNQVDRISEFTLDSTNAVRGFMFVGSDTYLDPYNRAKTRVPTAISELRRLAEGNQAALADVDRLAAALGEFQADMDRKVERRKILGYSDEILKEIYVPEDRQRLEAIRSAASALKLGEIARQESRDENMDEGLSNTIWILIVSSLAGVVAIGLANFVVHREIKKRAHAESALVDVNRGLEERIALRTEELQEMNSRLLEIGNERETLLLQESRSRQEAEIANRLRDEFMATISHELRTPLNSILGWARLLKDGGLSDEQSVRALTTIIKNSETQNRLIEDLLDVARLISGKLELESEEVDLVESVSESIEIAGPATRAKGLRVIFAGRDGRPVVNGDKNRLRQVFSNLLTNAVKFSHEGANIYVCVEQHDGQALIKFRDEGVGISKEFLPLVFERFRQDTSVQKRSGGLGLGLAIVRNLVEMHGGSVAVESDGSEAGAEFTVRLPTVQA